MGGAGRVGGGPPAAPFEVSLVDLSPNRRSPYVVVYWCIIERCTAIMRQLSPSIAQPRFPNLSPPACANIRRHRPPSMRLLNTSTLGMKDFISDHDRPLYAILSHTWGEQEISWAQWQNRHASPIEATLGGAKILDCCRQALADGFAWVWVDTCCIDKSSSAELSEAINSMFRWYRDAEICYAYLSDVPNAPPSSREAWSHMRKSKWFTRGWTLQELVAPKDLRFYSEDWQPLGTKAQFADLISSMTHISIRFLFGDNLDLASIAQKMSWAANRQTTRLEDQAYSLLGIFDINIPLLYGEGSKAFQRLQHTLLITYPEDQSLFVWGKIVSGHVENPPVLDSSVLNPGPMPWRPPSAGSELHGILATSPADFAESYNVVPCRTAAERFYHDSNYRAQLPSLAGNGTVKAHFARAPGKSITTIKKYLSDPPIAQLKEVASCLILCNYDGLPESAGTFAMNLSIQPLRHPDIFDEFSKNPRAYSFLTSTAHLSSMFLPGDIIQRRSVVSPKSGVIAHEWWSGLQVGFSLFSEAKLARAGNVRGEIFAKQYGFKDKKSRGFGILVERVTSPAHEDGTCLKFAIVPCQCDTTDPPVTEKRDGVSLVWYTHPLTSFRYGPIVTLRDSGHLVGNGGRGYSWTVEEKPFPKIFVSIEKFPLRAGGFVDVVDFIVGPEMGELETASRRGRGQPLQRRFS
ncbi:heterokaryon incompatibility protein-domain-containing protein [Schizothecium vesticola]|uniref:Heterokaryon incompatibility protein-domain-containing protein n=1 Tax=Schizothecium vesticola TaxID=314040 RepID=A0AA40F492_9PEZI|nr:heterokaryon incompatibility protein-domain-containing protein [Schizothecium vesticola]